MKSKVIVINNIKCIIIFFIAITFFVVLITITSIINKIEENTHNNLGMSNIQSESNNIYMNEDIYTSTNSSIVKENKESIKDDTNNKDIFPEQIDGFDVIGMLEIPKINLSTYILSTTTKESLNKSVTKLCGPKINGVGNFCITGHNYKKDIMFGNLKNLEIGDKILVTDINGITLEYIIYNKYKIYPKETTCLSQDTKGEREVTLITCTTGAIKRLIIKAIEVYD